MNNLPVTLADAALNFSSPEEYAAAVKATHALQQLVDQHNEGQRHDREDTRRAADEEQFPYGQDFDTNPEVWEEIEPLGLKEIYDQIEAGDDPYLLDL